MFDSILSLAKEHDIELIALTANNVDTMGSPPQLAFYKNQKEGATDFLQKREEYTTIHALFTPLLTECLADNLDSDPDPDGASGVLINVADESLTRLNSSDGRQTFHNIIKGHVQSHGARELGIARIDITFTGSNDDGGVESVGFYDSDGNPTQESKNPELHDDLPDDLLNTFLGSSWYDGNGMGGELSFNAEQMKVTANYSLFNADTEMERIEGDLPSDSTALQTILDENIPSITVSYSGSDDESDGYEYDLPDGVESPERTAEAIEELTDTLLNTYVSGYENSNGASGTVKLNIGAGTFLIEHARWIDEDVSIHDEACIEEDLAAPTALKPKF